MNKHHAERAYLLYLAKSGIPSARRPAGPITPSDYAAVYTPPTNNPTPFYGPCLIWRHRLDADGYGTLRLDGRTCKAHRVAYELSRGSIPKGKYILHICHRRSCIQPSHLYAGTRKENADDRQKRLTEKGRWEAYCKFTDEYNPRVNDSLKYLWAEPPEIERTLFQQQTGKHDCKYTIPAGVRSKPDGKIGEARLCQICFERDPDWLFRSQRPDPKEKEAANRAKYLQLFE